MPAESMLSPDERRDLAREISRLASASVERMLAAPPAAPGRSARRIGFTGPPGVGKSTLVGSLVERRAARGTSVAVLAIDPASPYSKGAILGDRIRMDRASDNSRVFMRSVSSRDSQDGMCNNVADILTTLEASGFDEVVLETVGVGQAEHAVKALVDTVVLLMQPETGDAIQALKAGILEVADIIVISKSDLPGSARMREHLASTVRFGAKRAVDWTTPVLGVSVDTGAGLEELEQALDAHAQWATTHRDAVAIQRSRMRYRVQDLILRQLDHTLASLDDTDYAAALPALYAATVKKLLPRP
jgi:LAO/AO transport system kinase